MEVLANVTRHHDFPAGLDTQEKPDSVVREIEHIDDAADHEERSLF
jgi:hypothetical protein